MKTKKQYLIVDTKKHRRHSAPENLGGWFTPQQNNTHLLEREGWCRASVSDFSVLVENQSESGSSLELDTSTLSRDLSPIPTGKSTPKDSYENISVVEFENQRKNEESRNYLGSRFAWRNILMSQAIAGCLAIMDISICNIKQNSNNLIINGQNLPHYILLGILWTTKLFVRNDGRNIIEILNFRYLFLSVLHVEANYLLCSSFHHTTYLGNQMIDCVASTLTFVIAFVCLEVQFQFIHIFGFAFTNVGAIGLCVANIFLQNQSENDVILGDVLRLASGICIGLNSIAQEIIVKSIDFVEYMGMIGLIGSIVCGLQTIALERTAFVPKNFPYWTNILSYSVAQFLLNSLTPIVLRETGATGLHLALTSSGFYSYFIRVAIHQRKLQVLYVISFAAAIIGSILFISRRTSVGTEHFYPIKVVISKTS